jgi:hypothetical protein
MSATVAEPGVISQTGTFMRLVFGELDGRPSQRGAALQALCRGAGFDSTNTNEIIVALWEKFVLLAANSSATGISDLCHKPTHAAQQNRSYSITSSARTRTDDGISNPSALAALLLTINSSLVGNSTGRSAGLAPFRIT